MRRGRTVSLLVALVGLATTIIVAARGSLRAVVLNQSVASGAALIVAAAFTLIAAALVVAPMRWWRHLEDGWRRWSNGETRCSGPSTFGLLLAVGLATQILLLVICSKRNTTPSDDQADYLRVALVVEDLGGVSGFPAAILSGEFTEDNRHPLYVAFLALRPTFAFGKLLSAGFSVLLLVTAAGFAYRQFGPLAGGLTACLIGVNGALLQAGSLVACETLLCLLVFLFWATLWISTPDSGRNIAGMAAAGVFGGLAYLTKASAFFLAATSTAIVLLGSNAGRRSGIARAGTLAAVTLLVSSPLLIRNVRVYDNPLHSFNTRLLFADSYEEGASSGDRGLVGNLRRYAQSHSWTQAARRLADGLLGETLVLLRCLGPTSLDSGRAAFGVFLLALGLLYSLTVRSAAALHLWAWVLVLWVFFGWYQPIASGDRFLTPLIAPLLVLASAALSRSLVVWKKS